MKCYVNISLMSLNATPILKNTLNDSLFEDILKNGWCLLKANSMAVDLENELKNIQLMPASIHEKKVSPSQTIDFSKEIRNDFVSWIDIQSCVSAEINWLSYLSQISQELSHFFRISLNSVETHYAFYPIGHFYHRHSDQKKVKNQRFFSLVLYLNHQWQESDGGHLVGYRNQEIIFKIKPTFADIILFKSDIEHEVLMSHRDRFSVAAWFRTESFLS